MAFFQNNPRTRMTVQSRIQNRVVVFSTTVRPPAAPTVATTQKNSLFGEPTVETARKDNKQYVHFFLGSNKTNSPKSDLRSLLSLK